MTRPFLSTFLFFIFALSLMLSACEGKNKKAPSQQTIETVKSNIKQFKHNLPVESGFGMLITDIEFDDATNIIVYKYQYKFSVASKPSEQQIKEAKNAVVSFIKAANPNSEDKQLLEQGISYRYDYYSADDKYLYSIDISNDDIPD